MKRYYKLSFNNKYPHGVQIIRQGYRNPDFTGWDSGRAVFTLRFKPFLFSVHRFWGMQP